MPKRLAKPRDNLSLVVVVVVLLISVGASGVAGTALLQKGHTLEQADAHSCARLNKIYTQIQVTLERSMKSLPKIHYYQQHPQELKAAEQNLHQEYHDFQPVRCP